MAVSSPDEGDTCNCQHGDHANANGHQAGMYNQDLGRANWQGQGLPQPKQDKDSCQCDEKPAEADKVPNADARISDKEMKKPKKKGGFQLNYDNLNEEIEAAKKKKKKIKKMTPAQLESRKKKKPYRQTDLRRRKYREKKEIHISDLEEGGDGIYRPDVKLEAGKKKKRKKQGERIAQENRNRRAYMKYGDGRWGIPYKKIKALEDIIKKHRPELFIGDLDEEGKLPERKRLLNIRDAKRQKRKLPPRTVNEHDSKRSKYRVREGVEGLDKKIKALEEIIKKRKTRRGGRRGATRGHFSGKWRKTLTPQQTKETTKNKVTEEDPIDSW